MVKTLSVSPKLNTTMNLQNILHEIESVDADMYERLDHVSRRQVFQGWLNKALAGTAVAAFSTVLNKAYAQNSSVAEVLNFALTLEYLEAEFYNRSLDAGIIPGPALPYYQQIAKHENAHVALLRGALGSAAISKPTFDFTGKGAFPDVFTNVATNYAVAQAFEDTGVRAYKGQAANLISVPVVLTVALQIHSVEARHAARIRMLRMQVNGVAQQGYVTGTNSGGVPAAVYAGEDNVQQGPINVFNLVTSLGLGISEERATEAFDETLTRAQVLAIAGPFIVS
jgi:Ferritin-like domain